MARRFTTPIVLPTDPTSALEASPKQYVDAQIAGHDHSVKWAYVTTAVSKTSDDSLSDLTGLTWTLGAGIWAFEGWLHFHAHPSGGLKFGWTKPGDVSGSWAMFAGPFGQAPVGGAQGRINYVDTGALSWASVLGVVGDNQWVGDGVFTSALPRGVLYAPTGGTMTMRMGQNVSNGTASVVLGGSWARFTKLASL